jgi:hypothetical protein
MACDTVRAYRKGLPTTMLPRNTNLQCHKYNVAKKNELVFMNWMDTNNILTQSNFPQERRRGE